MLNTQDLALLQRKGITPELVEHQLQQLRQGFPYLRLSAAASPGHGIMQPTPAQRESALGAWQDYLAQPHHRVVKFVPASGAASRMFKDLFAYAAEAESEPASPQAQQWLDSLEQAPYLPALSQACQRLYQGLDALQLRAAGRGRQVAHALLSAEGLGYGQLPKGLLAFHQYPQGARTPAEEHLVEGALYAQQADHSVNVHFTVSPEHQPLFEQLVERVAPQLEQHYGVTYHVSFSQQRPDTDTIAAAPDFQPFRQTDGSLLFRPGGHGALIENLGALDADIVFVKNIDNVVPDRLKSDTVEGKRLLAGVLVQAQAKAFEFLRLLDTGAYTRLDLMEMLQFVQKTLCTKNPETKLLEDTELAIYLRSKLNRPMRVCGMVKNVGEPGGGPFLAYNPDGTISPQILESSQIDLNDPEKKAMFTQGTHFNPVDLVCALRDYHGERFHLADYVDPQTGFISHKSKEGRELLALELPGLWNGAMSQWSTIFVEVPLSTFNPVKTVNDLLREQHQ